MHVTRSPAAAARRFCAHRGRSLENQGNDGVVEALLAAIADERRRADAGGVCALLSDPVGGSRGDAG